MTDLTIGDNNPPPSAAHAATMRELEQTIRRQRQALLDIIDLVDSEADVDDGQPNTAMACLAIARDTLEGFRPPLTEPRHEADRPS